MNSFLSIYLPFYRFHKPEKLFFRENNSLINFNTKILFPVRKTKICFKFKISSMTIPLDYENVSTCSHVP